MPKSRFLTKCWAKCFVAFLPMFFGTVASADDTDIFLGTGGASVSGAQPNVLFILDNSSSMNRAATDSNGYSTGQSRLEAMKDAFSEIMSTVSGINVGIMRFNSPGGSILYPVSNTSTSLANADFQTVPDMFLSADDATEVIAAGVNNGQVTLDDDTLRLGFLSTGGSTTTVTGWIKHQDDDREELLSDGSEWDGIYINMNDWQYSAVRYYDMNIPRGATITSAKLVFTSPYDGYYGDLTVEISGQYADNPARFSGMDDDLDDRYTGERTTNFVNWPIPDSQRWDNGTVHDSPDITDVVQELVDHPDWDPNDAMVFFLRGVAGSGERSGTLYRDDRSWTQGQNGDNTKLVVEYTTTPSDLDLMTGLRFQQVNIPQGATITSARVNFIAAASHSTTDNLQLRVRAENVDDAQPFTTGTGDLSLRSKTSAEELWSPEADWTVDESITGPDVTDLVQEVVSRSGWCGNNSLAIYLEPTSGSPAGSRLSYAFDSTLQQHAELVVSYTGGASGCFNQVWSKRVNSREDDAEQYLSGNPFGISTDSVSNSSSDLDIRSGVEIGIRFEGIPAIRGATIQEAYLEMAAYGDNSGNMSFTIHGQDHDNATAFVTSYRNISNRTKTSNSVTWNPVDFVDAQVYRSPDIKDVIQEIVGRTGWQAGNALALILNSNSSTDRSTVTYDHSPGLAPKLILKIGDGGASSSTLTVATHINDLVQNLEGRTYTPIVDSLYEAALYFRGEELDWSKARGTHYAVDQRYKRVSVESSYTGQVPTRDSRCTADNLDSSYCRSEYIGGTPTFISPITSDCQSNHIVLLTDGEANDNGSINKILSLTGEANCNQDTAGGSPSGTNERCAGTLAWWMANNDMAPSLSAANNTITTHTVAFNLSSSGPIAFLQNLASRGGGTFNTANTSSELVDAFDAIIRNVISTESTFTSPGATVNQFNRLTNRDEIYFSVFKPTANPLWSGNLKRYKLRGDASASGDDTASSASQQTAAIVDANDQEAVDNQTGFFKSTAKSIWSPSVDGANVDLGGAASQLPDTVSSRKVYTYLRGAATPSTSLTAPANALTAGNSEITISMLGAANSTQRDDMLNWIRGQDVLDDDGDNNFTEARKHIGDPLHSIPHLVTYGGTDSSPDVALFFGSNEGYIHAIDADDGSELFSFMPESLLGNIRLQYENSSAVSHPYGMDGSIVSWVKDADFDNLIEPNNNEFVYLYAGMRRGGNNYYALDVSDRTSPELLWEIVGGSGDYSKLGQTWSKPVKTKVKIGETTKDVLFFAGGFDPALDNTPNGRVNASVGNAIFMVDAGPGDANNQAKLLWMATKNFSGTNGMNAPDMHYAIPSDLSVVDTNFDGLADQIYVGDMGGQVWRFDITNGNSASQLIDGGVIAALGSNAASEARRFFARPDVSLIGANGSLKLAVAIGSGHINEPLEKITNNRFYLLLQDDVYNAPAGGYTTLTETDLDDRTNNLTAAAAADGWYIDLEASGEKNLSAPLIISGNLLFTTYEPSVAANACSGVTGIGRLYLLDLATGQPSEDLDSSGNINKSDRLRELASPSIPPTPKLLFPEESSKPVLLIGPEQPIPEVTLVETDDWEPVFWQEN